MEKEYTNNQLRDMYLDWFFNYQVAGKKFLDKYNITASNAKDIINLGCEEHRRQVDSDLISETVGYGNKIIKEI
jgi:hypothetical protein